MRRSRRRCKPHPRPVCVPEPVRYPLRWLGGGCPRSLQTQSLARALWLNCRFPWDHRRSKQRTSVRGTKKVPPLLHREYWTDLKSALTKKIHVNIITISTVLPANKLVSKEPFWILFLSVIFQNDLQYIPQEEGIVYSSRRSVRGARERGFHRKC